MISLREFTEARLAGYRAGTDPVNCGGDSAFPDTAISFAANKVREDCLRRLLRDYDTAVAMAEAS